jgi:hypothetical protein
MSRKELTKEERELLSYCLRRWWPELLPKLDVLDSVSPQVIDNMRDAISIEVGEAVKGGINTKEYADKLEDLIDRLYDL